MTTEFFTVDAKLLRELGERLVGRPHIALAELIKNSYDADARNVEIVFGNSYIEILDDGHGMSRESFVKRWMRIGTTHKAVQRRSPELRRRLTGSKGVGRLSAQLLARHFELSSVALIDPTLQGIEKRRGAKSDQVHPEVRASVDWDLAVGEQDLTSVPVDVQVRSADHSFAANSVVGTRLVLRRLAVDWDAERFRRLAREIWSLQPPFDLDGDSDRSFTVTLVSDEQEVEDVFASQMAAVLEIWSARIHARLREDDGEEVTFDISPESKSASATSTVGSTSKLLEISLDLRDNKTRSYLVRIPSSYIGSLDYEIRVFDLNNRQPLGVRVEDARAYLREFGGIHIYDSDFRLPYYGPDEDWLGIETYHSHRLSRLRLLPDSLQTRDAGNEIPTNSRLYGLARISTGAEAIHAEHVGLDPQHTLTIQVTRDRLVDNDAFGLLRRLVNVGLDLYAFERSRKRAAERGLGRDSKPGEPTARPSTDLSQAIDIISANKAALPEPEYERVKQALDSAFRDTTRLEASSRAHSALLGALATAGMTALAYEHESSKQRALIARSAKTLNNLAPSLDASQKPKVTNVIKQLEDWARRAERLRGLFAPLLDETDRTEVVAYRAREVLQDVAQHVDILSRGTAIDVADDDENIRLPPASYAAWTSIFQNLFINAFNATLEAGDRQVYVSFGSTSLRNGLERWIRIQDTGVGVDPSTAERFFKPFEREGSVNPESAALGLGGSGLGLTIVRMVATEAATRVAFVEPDSGYSTCVQLTWKED